MKAKLKAVQQHDRVRIWLNELDYVLPPMSSPTAAKDLAERLNKIFSLQEMLEDEYLR